MKKNQILVGLFLVGMTLGACTEDYTDWAAPQSNPSEEAAAKYEINFAAGADAAIVMDDVYAEYKDNAEGIQDDAVSIATLSSSNAMIESISVGSVHVNGNAIAAELKNGQVMVNTLELDRIARDVFKSRAHVERTLDVTMNVSAKLTTGEAVAISGASQVKLTPVSTPEICEDGYYLLGDFQGWNPANPVVMTKKEEGIYTAVVTTTDGSSWFKFYRAYDTANPDWDTVVNPGQMGTAENGDAATENFLVWVGDPSCEAVQTPVISGINDYIVTLDVINMSFKVTVKTVDLFMTGSNYEWGGTWKQLTPIYGAEGEYWVISYFTAGEQFKFAPQAGWGSDFGGEATLNDEAGSGIHADGTNLVIDNAGWYLLHVVNGADRVVNVLVPNVYLIGNTAGGWDIADANKFTIPEGPDGEFVSPAFVASDEVRMCVSFGGYDWWKTEFIVLNGAIVYRGVGGDQERVKVSEGQKAYLNFMTGTGSFK